ncbi:MAG: hypothetical protein M3Y22_09100, partial [Pseudomonadota bacterium]|nr:hypothetical protein [Pseudomonadota bacterium]
MRLLPSIAKLAASSIAPRESLQITAFTEPSIVNSDQDGRDSACSKESARNGSPHFTEMVPI